MEKKDFIVRSPNGQFIGHFKIAETIISLNMRDRKIVLTKRKKYFHKLEPLQKKIAVLLQRQGYRLQERKSLNQPFFKKDPAKVVL